MSMWWRRSFSTMNNMNLFFLWRNSDLLSSFSDVYVCIHLSLFSYVIYFLVVNIVDSFAIEASFLLFAWILKRVPHTIKFQFILSLVIHKSTLSNNIVNFLNFNCDIFLHSSTFLNNSSMKHNIRYIISLSYHGSKCLHCLTLLIDLLMSARLINIIEITKNKNTKTIFYVRPHFF